ncbi:MAG TPA: potassium transporter TrkH, partial [Desulfobacterales bacterium]|nr:potassium transporter TrkH [Desulfobacterales bacterium]
MTKPAIMPPLLLPVLFFAAAIVAGSMLLHSSLAVRGAGLSWTDALFTATSATCVTGLVVVDTGSRFSTFGQAVILALIQAGGLGIMTFTSLAFYLRHHRISLVDRVAVGQMLLHDPSFHLGRFLTRIVLWTVTIEAVGALTLHLLAPQEFTGFNAVFHAVSAFCNAGFS